ncbi:DUF2850 domain-containing protein [Photobacterium nomapromontoriensis]|uniref:DUF2850 domain-containing protein n=1 Tax=Photobacterium nomapromontoriensis TaxID=2910237 RepID=UPI003D0F574E
MSKQKKKTTLPVRLTYGFIVVVAIYAVTLGLWTMGKLGGGPASELLPDISGVWVEQDVAPYMADRFEIRPTGVFVDGRQVNSQYQWDGHKLEYRLGDQLYSYSFASNQLIRQRPAHYISSFSR